MKCPYCNSKNDFVIDSRPVDEEVSIRRRRECTNCNKRYTTYERLETMPITVIKRDGSKEFFDRNKLRTGIITACRKTPVTVEDIEKMVALIEQEFQSDPKEIKTSQIGKQVLKRLKKLDKIAYIRFLSVYDHFDEIEEFIKHIKSVNIK
ncbi:transcriptional regulator NrdR [bacterium]